LNIKNIWKTGILSWHERDAMNISVVFTWDLPEARKIADLYRDRKVRIGGPAVELAKLELPGFFLGCHAEIGGDYPGVLQRFNHLATRTSVGCPRKCKFCSVPRVAAMKSIEMSGAPITALADWPDLPVLADDNLLFTPAAHFDKVCDRLEKWGWCDFNQGIDCRKLTDYHAERIARIKHPKVRMALDNPALFAVWDEAFEKLRRAGITKHNIHTYCICADTSAEKPATIEMAWDVCRFVEKHKVKPYPMWFHPLNSLERNKVTPEQAKIGWTDYERRRIMQWYYQHKHAVQ
jgi:hypothetical protein